MPERIEPKRGGRQIPHNSDKTKKNKKYKKQTKTKSKCLKFNPVRQLWTSPQYGSPVNQFNDWPPTDSVYCDDSIHTHICMLSSANLFVLQHDIGNRSANVNINNSIKTQNKFVIPSCCCCFYFCCCLLDTDWWNV